MDLDPRVGFENMRTLVGHPRRRLREKAQDGAASGHTPDMVKARYARQPAPADPREELQAERERLEKGIARLKKRLKEIEKRIVRWRRSRDMDIYEAIRTRKSVRAIPDQPVPEEVLDRVLDAARAAPSARKSRSGDSSSCATRRAGEDRAGGGPSAVHRDRARRSGLLRRDDGRLMRCGTAYPIDVAIAMDHLSLAAAAEGLGTCWIGSFDEQREAHSRHSREVRVVQLMPLGFPADHHRWRRADFPSRRSSIRESW